MANGIAQVPRMEESWKQKFVGTLCGFSGEKIDGATAAEKTRENQ